jgi:1-acyl-sn-glycerol-3-phosphate acyltransferase
MRPIHVVRLLLLVLNTAVIAPMVAVIGLFERDGKVAHKLAQRWMAFNLWFSRVHVKVSGLEHLDPKKQYIFMSNHRSAADIVAIGVALWDYQIRFVAKKELLRVPLFGWGLWGLRSIIIDRRNHVQALRSYAVAGQRIRRGISVVVFPEGTRGEGGELLPFKKGGFVLAIETGTPIAPIAVVGTEAVMPKRSLRIESGTVEVRIGTPIETAGVAYKEKERLLEQVRSSIAALASDESGSQPIQGLSQA